jgi:hypothetical protein
MSTSSNRAFAKARLRILPMANTLDGFRAGSPTLRIATSLAAFVLSLAGQTSLLAQGEDSASHAKLENKLAKETQNPVANLVSLPLQFNFYTAGGLGPNTQMVFNVQPVLPLPVTKHWLLISRTIVPFLSMPLPVRTGGIGDIQEQAYFTAAKPGKFTWGVGPVLSFPTATNLLARTGQWGAGPTAVGLVMPGHWVIGALANNIWRIGGEAHNQVLNSFLVQPFINYNLPYAWSISTAPIITANWSAPSGEKWTVPIGIGVGKITHIDKQPMSLGLQYYHNLEHPRFAGAEQVRFIASFLWPTAEAAAAAEKSTVARKKSGDQ